MLTVFVGLFAGDDDGVQVVVTKFAIIAILFRSADAHEYMSSTFPWDYSLVTTTGLMPPAGWYADPSDEMQVRWWSGSEWTPHVQARAAAPVQPVDRPKRPRRPGAGGAAIIVFSSVAVWLYAASAELFWLGQHGSRFVVVGLASIPSGAGLLYVMCRRLRPNDRISASLLVTFAAVGGFVALLIPSLTEPAWEQFTVKVLHAPLLAPTIAGPLEEACKLAVVVVLARWAAVRNARTGLFVGGAVGIGYAVFENIDYALNATGHGGPALSPGGHLSFMVSEVLARQTFTPFAHPVFTAVCAAALFASCRNGKFRISGILLLAFAWSVVMHSLWDDIPGLLEGLPGGFVSLGSFVLRVALSVIGILVWREIAKRANRRSATAVAAAAAEPSSAEDNL